MADTKKRSGYENGGQVKGPGGPTDDAVPINASNGEYVIPAEVVHFLGTGFFDRLVQKAQMDAAASKAAPGPFDDMAVDESGAMVPGGMPSGRPY